MEFLFLINDMFSWMFIIALVIWVAVLTQSAAKSEKAIKYLSNKLDEAKNPDTSCRKLNETDKKPSEHPVYNSCTPQPPKPAETISHPASVSSSVKTGQDKPKQKTGMENLFLGNIFNKVGALALIVALIIFIKLVSSYIVFTNVMKISAGFIAGLILFLGGAKLHLSEKFKNFSEVLIGTGFAAFFITTYCAYYLKVFNSLAAVLTGGVLLLAVFWAAHKMRTFSAVIIGLIGGYLTPYLSGAQIDTSALYLIFLNLVSVIYTLVNPKAKRINTVNLPLTMFIMLIAAIGADASKVVYPIAVWAVYVLYDLLRNKESRTDNVTCTMNYIFLALTTLILFKASASQVGIMYGITAFIYAVLAFFGKRFQNPLYKRYEHFIFLNVWFSILFTLNDIYSIITWSAAALMLSFAVKKGKLNTVKHYITFYYLSAIFGVMLAKDGSTFILGADLFPIFNLRTLLFLIPALSMTLSISRLKNTENTICNLLRFGVISLSYCYVMSEITCLINSYAKNNQQLQNGYLVPAVYTVMGFLYSIFFNSAAKKTNFTLFSVTGHILGAVSVITLLISGLVTPLSKLPVFNMQLPAYAAGLYYCYYYAKTYRSGFFKYLAVIIGFVFCASEGLNLDKHLNTGYMASLSWLLYSAGITLAGLFNKKKFLINSGIWIIILTILRIFIFDLANIEPMYKIVAFLALGVILMIISYIYIKQKND